MLLGTHALLPVGVCLVVDQIRRLTGLERWFSGVDLAVVAGFGILPDLCSPHLSLEDRYDSWSHNLAFLAGAALPAAAAGSFFETGRRGLVALACWVAVALHLAADAVSGGIVWLQPWRETVLGGPYVPFRYWWWSDAAAVVLIGFLWWLTPRLEARWIGGNR